MTTTTSSTDIRTDRNGLRVLDVDDCWRLLDEQSIGRLAFQHEGGTVILPVSHLMVGHAVVFRSTRGSKFNASVMAKPAVFEVDGWDAATRTGWSVIVSGTLDVVDDTTELDRMGHQPWAPLAGEPLWMQLRPLDISGREIPTTAR